MKTTDLTFGQARLGIDLVIEHVWPGSGRALLGEDVFCERCGRVLFRKGDARLIGPEDLKALSIGGVVSELVEEDVRLCLCVPWCWEECRFRVPCFRACPN